MLAHFDLQLLLIFISIPLILSQCSGEVNKCFIKFASDLDTHKSRQSNGTDEQLHDICDGKSGIFYKFVNCITSLEQQCSSDTKFVGYLCETRKLKMRISRYSWKPQFFYEICHNTSSQFSQGFIKHEPCISSVMNDQKWKCDFNYDKKIKALKSWKSDINTLCSLWRNFRDCIKTDIKQKCGIEASNISDHLFHSHQNYFEKYNTCDLEGVSSNQCSYDLLTSTPATLISSTTVSTTISSTESVVTQQTHQSLPTNSFNTNPSTETSYSMTFEYNSSLTEVNATTLESIKNSSSLNESSALIGEYEIPKDERVLNDSASQKSEIEEKNIALADIRIESNDVETNSKLSNDHSNDKLTLSTDHNNLNSKESIHSSNAIALRIEFLFSLFLTFSIKFFL